MNSQKPIRNAKSEEHSCEQIRCPGHGRVQRGVGNGENTGSNYVFYSRAVVAFCPFYILFPLLLCCFILCSLLMLCASRVLDQHVSQADSSD